MFFGHVNFSNSSSIGKSIGQDNDLHDNYEVVRRFLEHYKIFYLIIQKQTRRKNCSVDLPSNKMLAWQHC